MRRFLIIIFFALLFANIIAFDVWVFQHNKVSTPVILSGNAARTAAVERVAQSCDFSCPKSCLDKINEATASLKPAAQAEVAPLTKTVVVTQPAASLKEFYIALGTGTGVGNDWKDIDNTDTKVDLSGFSRIKTVYFEVAGILQNDNVTANVRLYNVTDKQPVWNSEVTINKLKCQTLTSAPISLAAGVKTYRLQVKSTLNATVYVDQARLRIVAE